MGQEPAQKHRILVRTPNWIGDQILAYPFFHELRQAYPHSYIAAACPPWVQAVQFKNLVDQVVVLPRPLGKSFLERLGALEKGAQVLRQLGPWDLGFSLPNSFTAAGLLYRAGVKTRIGYSTEGRGFLLNKALKWEKKCLDASVRSNPGSPSRSHRSEAYLGLLWELGPTHGGQRGLTKMRGDERTLPAVEQLDLIPNKTPLPGKSFRKGISVGRKGLMGKDFWGIPAQNDLDPGIPGVLPEFDAEKAWPEAEPLEPPSEPYWVLAPGSTAESRRWPPSYFADLARKIAQDKGWKGIVVGGIAESDVASEWEKDPTLKLQDWTAKGTPASYWKIFKNAKLSVCNDSGLAHVASLCGSPVQVIWGGGNPLITEPMGPGRVRIAMNPVDCWPCESNTCQLLAERKLECLKGIYADTVWTEIKSGFRL